MIEQANGNGGHQQKRTLLVCPRCRRKFSISSLKRGTSLRCPSCMGGLIDPELSETVDTPVVPTVTSPDKVGGALRGISSSPGKADSASGGVHSVPGKVGSASSTSVRFGRYELWETIGEGGMATVFKAWDTQLGRCVALKKLRVDRAAGGSAVVARFQREARAAAKLRHPNIVQIYDVGVIDGEYYITMDYIEGESLQTLLGGAESGKRGGQRRISVKRGIEILRDVAYALDYAHKQGIVHRDVKPANILINAEGTAYLVDFGLAKDIKGTVGSGITLDGQFLGTPLYFSPEQAAGEMANVGPASDVYSLGVILYQLLTGVVPYEADSFMALAWQIINSEPAPPSKLSPTVSKDIEAVCLRALEKLQQHRYPDARSFGDDLQRYLQGEQVLARAVGPVERLWRRVKRNKWQAIVAGIASLIVVAAVVFFHVRGLKRRALANSQLAQALSFEAAGQYAKAYNLFQLVLQEFPEDKDALDGRARMEAALAMAAGEQEKEAKRARTRSEVEKLLRDAELAWFEAFNVLRNVELPLEKYHAAVERALNLYKEAEQRLPDYGWIYESRGRLKLNMNDLDGAESDLKRAVSLLDATEAKSAYRSLARLYIERAFELTYERREKMGLIMKKATAIAHQLAEATAAAKGEIGEDKSKDKTTSMAIVQALGAYSTGNLVGAEQILRNTLEQHASADVAYLLAMLTHLQGNPETKIEYLDKALRIQPRHVRGLVFRGYVRFMHGKEKQAIRDLDEALRIDPRCVQAFHVRGLAKAALGDHEGAIEDYNAALKIKPGRDVTLLARADSKRRLGQIDAAIEDYNECLELDDQDAWVYLYRGQTYEEAGLMNSAMEDYDRALEIMPKLCGARHARGRLRISKGDYDGAIADYSEAIKLDADDGVAYYNRAVARYRKGDFDGAVADCTECLKLRPNDGGAFYMRALARVSRVNETEDTALRDSLLNAALEDYNETLRCDPQHVDAYVGRASVLATQDRKAEAIADLEKALQVAPANWSGREEVEAHLRALRKK